MQTNTSDTGVETVVANSVPAGAVVTDPLYRHGTRILLADTGQLLREQLAAILSQSACEVMAAADGFEVLCRLPELRPDILLISNDLPRLGGIQVCALLRQSPEFRDLPILILGSSDNKMVVVEARQAGANAYLQKPFRRIELEAALADLLCETASGDAVPDKTGSDNTRFCNSSSDKETSSHGLPAHC